MQHATDDLPQFPAGDANDERDNSPQNCLQHKKSKPLRIAHQSAQRSHELYIAAAGVTHDEERDVDEHGKAEPVNRRRPRAYQEANQDGGAGEPVGYLPAAPIRDGASNAKDGDDRQLRLTNWNLPRRVDGACANPCAFDTPCRRRGVHFR